ncbi:hypothetical protein [Mesorhizobium sp.]|nr:hypothetical protein [Mesorhizobium sp.]
MDVRAAVATQAGNISTPAITARQHSFGSKDFNMSTEKIKNRRKEHDNH